jgi:hypothetical protein
MWMDLCKTNKLLPAFLNLGTLFLRSADDIILLASSNGELGHGERNDETENGCCA